MRPTALALALLAAFAAPSNAGALDEYLWVARPVIVFADSPQDPAFIKQMRDLASREVELTERDVVLLTDTDPAADGPLRREFHPRGFQLLLVGKDGGVKLRKPRPMNVDALWRHIDRMPMRREELRSE